MDQVCHIFRLEVSNVKDCLPILFLLSLQFYIKSEVFRLHSEFRVLQIIIKSEVFSQHSEGFYRGTFQFVRDVA